jgi:serine/alanine adding enzyme
MLNVEICQDPVGWDRYVEANPDAYNYHRWRWQQVIAETFGHQPQYLAAYSDGAIKGVLPLFSIRSRIFGNSLISVPFFTYGGMLADTQEAREGLMEKAVEFAGTQKIRRIELRQGGKLDCAWQQTSSKVTMDVALPASTDELWKRFSTGLRNKIRKGQKSEFRIQWGGGEAVSDFYSIFAANMRNLGTPVYPKSWFEAIFRHFPEQTRILNLWDGDRPVAGAFLSAYRHTLELPWSASLPDTRKKYSHYLLYWTFMEWAIQNGFRQLDLGRCTPGGGTYEFKRHWLCREQPLNWYNWVPAGAPVPQLRPDNARFQLAIEVWKHLPLAVANQLGPRVVRALP